MSSKEMHDTAIARSGEIKIIQCLLDSRLRFDKHVSVIASKVHQRAALIFR